jgi:hypothetical protein
MGSAERGDDFGKSPDEEMTQAIRPSAKSCEPWRPVRRLTERADAPRQQDDGYPGGRLMQKGLSGSRGRTATFTWKYKETAFVRVYNTFDNLDKSRNLRA